MAVSFRHNRGLQMILAMVLLCTPAAWAQSDRLHTGIEAVRAENYEEAVPILKTARQETPDSSLAAFFLGMAYKGAARYPEALPHLQDAVTLTPRIKDALIELIDLLLILSTPDHLEEAEQWISVAEADRLFPARTAFLKGRLLKKQEDFKAAAEAFEQAKSLDPDLAQTADYQIALSRLRVEEYDDAKDAFRRVIDREPESDLADFARQYRDLVEDRLFAERDLRITLTLLGQYDTNMVLRPTDDLAAVGVTGEEGFTTTDILSLEYLPDIEGPFTFYGQVAALANLHQHVGDTHDILGSTFTLQPGYGRDRWSVSLKGRYTHYLRRDPDYAAYLDQIFAGPVVRMAPFADHLFELQAGYLRRNFFDAPLIPEEDRDSDGFSAALSWIWRATPSLFLNGGYEYIRENTDGANWDNQVHRFLAAAHWTLIEDLTLQLSVEEFIQDFDEVHSIFGKKREDHVNVASAGLVYDIHRRLSLLFHFARTRSNSNLAVYDYTRNLTSLGVEFRF